MLKKILIIVPLAIVALLAVVLIAAASGLDSGVRGASENPISNQTNPWPNT